MPWWFTLLLWSAVFVISELIRPKPRFENARPSGLGDFNFPTATEGRSVPLVWGTVRIKGPNVVWYGGLKQQAIKEEVKTGMFSSTDVVTGYKYFVGMVFALCRGPVDSCVGIFINDKLASGGRTGEGALDINAINLQGGETFGTGGISGSGTFYVGNDTQVANSYLSTQLSPSPVPGFRGTCYYIFEGGYVGTSPNIQPWAFDIKRIPDGLNLTAVQPGDELVNGTDANPMNVLYEILTDTDWGLKVSSSEIDIDNFRAAAATLANENNGFSFILDGEMEATELITEIQRQIDGSLYFDRATGQWKMTLIRDDYTPSSLPLFDEDNIVSVSNYSRTTWWETVNQVRLLFTDIDDHFKETFALAQDMANVQLQGGNISVDVRYPGVKHRGLANSLVWRDLATLAYPLAKASIQVNREGFDLKPGSAFRWSWSGLEIDELVMRITRINPGSLDSGTITMEVTQDIFATPGAGTFGDPTATGWTDPALDAVPVVSADTLIFEAPRQMVVEDPFAPSQQPRVWLGARDPGGGTVGFEAWSRAGTSRPLGGIFDPDTTIFAFLLAGKLENDLNPYGTSPNRPDISYSINVLEDPDDLLSLVLASSRSFIRNLLTIAYVDGEFIGFEDVSTGSGKVTLSEIYRGLFHTAPKFHAANTRVWFIGQTGGNLSRTAYTDTQDEIDYKLRSVSSHFIVAEIDTPTEEVTLNPDRIYTVPLAPRDPYLNNVYADQANVSLDTQYIAETGLTGEDARAVKVAITPRAWRVDDILDDHNLNLSDVDWLDDSPSFDFTLTLDPGGTPVTTQAFSVSGTETPIAYILRNAVIEALGDNTVIPSTARLSVTAKHNPTDLGLGVLTNPVAMELDMTIVSALQGADDLVFGGIPVSTISAVVTFGETGTYSFDIKTALPSSGILEGRINGGGFTTIITAGNSTGNLTGVTAGDTVELRFTQAPANDQFFDITGPTAEQGYGVLLA